MPLDLALSLDASLLLPLTLLFQKLAMPETLPSLLSELREPEFDKVDRSLLGI